MNETPRGVLCAPSPRQIAGKSPPCGSLKAAEPAVQLGVAQRGAVIRPGQEDAHLARCKALQEPAQRITEAGIVKVRRDDFQVGAANAIADHAFDELVKGLSTNVEVGVQTIPG